MTGATDSPFHVDLRGVVDLLSHHLYSGPRVYLRELLQNSLDAVTARTQDDPQAPRRVRIVPAGLSPHGCLHVDDSGIGLDEDGIRAVLATIGASTKRDALGLARESFLGQFGIGLLSCFLVTDEIRVTTRRAGTDETWLWVGRDDGTYSVALSPQPRAEPGTDVALRPRGSAADLLSAEVVERLASSYASYLPVDLVVETAGGPVIAAGRRFPWEGGGRDAALSLGEVVVGARPLDVVDLSDPVAGVRGQAFVLPHPTGTRGGAMGAHKLAQASIAIVVHSPHEIQITSPEQQKTRYAYSAHQTRSSPRHCRHNMSFASYHSAVPEIAFATHAKSDRRHCSPDLASMRRGQVQY